MKTYLNTFWKMPNGLFYEVVGKRSETSYFIKELYSNYEYSYEFQPFYYIYELDQGIQITEAEWKMRLMK
jgi:hypothetical protein